MGWGALLLVGFITPRARSLGPEEGGGYLNRFLDHPHFSIYISSVEGLAVLTGAVLYWNPSSGLQSAWISSGPGVTFTIGAAAAILALAVSVPISRTLGTLYYLESDDLQGFGAMHQRFSRLGAVYTVLLVGAVSAMAAAPYMNLIALLPDPDADCLGLHGVGDDVD